MKKFTLLLLLLSAITSLKAQDYLISFAGTGASTTVGTVTVENLTQGTSISLFGSEVLHLLGTWNGINTISNSEKTLRIYPNPTTENSTIGFVATASGITNVELFDITGKRLGAVQNTLTIGTHSYQVSGVRSGIYTVRVSSQAYSYTGKLVSNSTNNSGVKITYLGNSVIPVTAKMLKSASAEKIMQYTTGDRLMITGASGNYSTVVMEVPTQSKTITFPFVTCQDADLNNYSVVTIGTQTWMVQNLKTTKFRTGEDIGTTTPATLDISAESTPNYQWAYNGDENMAAKYGRLYTWYAVVDSRNIAPIGWHVSTDAEWTTLENYVSANLGTSGFVAKSLAATTDWPTDDYSVGTIGKDLTKNNTSGFTALPGGYRYYNRSFDLIGIYGYWWSSTEDFATYVWNRILNCCDGSLGRYDSMKSEGLSVRCVRDDTANNYTITTSSNPTAGGTTSGGGTFVSGSSKTVTATANTGYTFSNWTENGSQVSTNASYTFTISSNRTLVANFAVIVLGNFSINLSSNPPEGGTTSGGGTFIQNSVKTVTASPNTGYSFVNWTEGGVSVSSSATYQLALVANRTLVANFLINTSTLTVNATNGTVASNPNQTSYNYGSTVLLTATANSGYIFTGWTGNATGNANPLSVTMDQNKTITANFTAIVSNYTLNVSAVNGLVIKNPYLVSYASGASVILTAIASMGYTFTSWSGDATGTNPSVTVIMNSNKIVTANFKH